MKHTENVSESASAIQDAVRAFVRFLGGKRGLHEASEAIGVTPRVAKAALYGEHFAAPEDRAMRALAAEMRLLDTEVERAERRRAELHRRLAALEMEYGSGSLQGREEVDRGAALGCVA